MNFYRIEKVRCTVAVVMMGGERYSGEIFLNPTSRFRSARQEPAEFLNEDEAYFALAMDDGRTALVAKARVESVTVESQGDPGNDAIGSPHPHPASVSITMASGDVVRGTVSIDAPPSHARLLDFLNTNHERFLRVADAGRVILVNRQAIGHVHEQS